MPVSRNCICTLAIVTREDDSIRYLLDGSGTDGEKLAQFREEHGLDNMQIIGRVEWARLLSHYRQASVLYAQLKDVDALSSAEPSKLFEYFATGKPVIYGGAGLGADLAAQFENTLVIKPDDPGKLIDAVLEMRRRRLPRSERNIDPIRDRFVREQIFEDYLSGAGLL